MPSSNSQWPVVRRGIGGKGRISRCKSWRARSSGRLASILRSMSLIRLISPPSCARSAFRIPRRTADMPKPNRVTPLPERGQQGLVRQNVDQARRSPTGTMQTAYRRLAKNSLATIAGNPQAVGQIMPDLLAVQAFQGFLKCDPLPQLAYRWFGEFAVELRLSKQHNLQQLALFGFQ